MTPEEFRKIRTDAGLSFYDLAERIGWKDVRTLRRFEKGGRPISDGCARKMAEIRDGA